ncbi:MAG TPA: hypothetical protein VFV50_01835 [Bdellovibrionales bacterium]|nr:hypothetical protein [Bdellovibrionales bacterium]
MNVLMTAAFAVLVAFAPVLHAQEAAETPLQKIEKQLQTEGLTGLVHGADHDRGLYVFAYHLPGDFFARYNLSLTTKSVELKKLLRTLGRNDRIFVKGKFGGQETPQPHIVATEIQVLKKNDNALEAPAGSWQKEVKLPEGLANLTEIVVQVHAIAGEGQVLVIEYRDAIIPVVVAPAQARWTRDLYRGDVIRIRFEIQESPGRPTHLVMKPMSEQKPFDMLQRLVERHNKVMTITGRLVLFPKSPTISRDIWAVEEQLAEGLTRYLTLVNFTETNGQLEEWDKIDKKLRALWNEHKSSVFEGRNKYINLAVTIKATGTVTVFDANQANAQIHLTADKLIAGDR